MKKIKILSLIALFLIVLMPLSSAIYIGEAESEPTEIMLTITEQPIEDDEELNIEENRHSQKEAIRKLDEEYESELREIKYEKWKCINNKLQRIITSLNHEEIEYGKICGVEEENHINKETNFNKLLIVISIILSIFILLTLVLISLIMLNK